MLSIRFLSHGLLAVGLCAALAACGRKADAPEAAKTGAAAPAAAPVASAESAIDSVGGKLQGYIECYNQLDGRAQRSISRYASWVRDMKAGPSGNEQVVYGLYEVDTEGVAKCSKVFAQVAAAKPALAKLDAAGATYISALAAMESWLLRPTPTTTAKTTKTTSLPKAARCTRRWPAALRLSPKPATSSQPRWM